MGILVALERLFRILSVNIRGFKACAWRISIAGLFEGTLTVGISRITLAGLFEGTSTVGTSKMTLAGLFEGTWTVRISKMTLAELFQGTLMVVIHIMTLAERFEGTLTFGTRKGTQAGLFQGTLMVPKPTLNGAGFRGFYGLSQERTAGTERTSRTTGNRPNSSQMLPGACRRVAGSFARGLAAVDAAKSLAGVQMLPPENTNTHTQARSHESSDFDRVYPRHKDREGRRWLSWGPVQD